MMATYEEYLESVQSHAVRGGIEDYRLARQEFHNLTGVFDEGEPWFDLRMSMFHDWYLLDRKGADGVTPVERFLNDRVADLSEEEEAQMELLTVTHRSVFALAEVSGDRLSLDDLAGGGQWQVRSILPTVGFSKNDVIGARIVFFGGQLTVGRGAVLHPQEARDHILSIAKKAAEQGMPRRRLVDHLDKMRLNLDRYSNIRIHHIYRYPKDASA